MRSRRIPPVAYKSFYDKFSNGPYAQSALKMAAQPKLIPLSQPTRILAPASIKLGGLGAPKDNFGSNPGAPGLPQGGQVVTLPSPGTKTTLGKAGADTGKIVTMPGSSAGKMGERPTSKLGGLTQVEKQTSKSAPLTGIHRRPKGIASAGNNQRFATSAQFRGSSGQARTGSGFRMMR